MSYGIALVCALVLAASAAAARPAITTIAVDVTNPDAIQCDGFALSVTIAGSIKVRSFVEDGSLVREVVTYRLARTATNPDTGASLRTPDVGVDIFRVEADGSATLMIAGVLTRVVVPGEGVVFADLGIVRLFFESLDDKEPDIVFEAGKHDDADELDGLICEALAP